jgi:hypothetical protein
VGKQPRLTFIRPHYPFSNQSGNKPVIQFRQFSPNARDASARRPKRSGLRPAPKSVIMLYRGKNRPDFGVCNPAFQNRFNSCRMSKHRGQAAAASG